MIVKSDMVTDKKVSKNLNLFCFKCYLFFVKIYLKSFCWNSFFGIVFVDSVISSNVIIESPIILSKYLPFLQVNVLGF